MAGGGVSIDDDNSNVLMFNQLYYALLSGICSCSDKLIYIIKYIVRPKRHTL